MCVRVYVCVSLYVSASERASDVGCLCVRMCEIIAFQYYMRFVNVMPTKYRQHNLMHTHVHTHAQKL